MSAPDRVSADTGDPVASIRLGVHFGPGEGKRFLNVDYPFDGTPEDFDRAFEECRVAFHEKASASVRPCGYGGPWATTASQSSVSKASQQSETLAEELPKNGMDSDRRGERRKAACGVAPPHPKSIRCRLGYHAYRYVGFRWVKESPWLTSGYSHECARCGATMYWATGIVEAREREREWDARYEEAMQWRDWQTCDYLIEERAASDWYTGGSAASSFCFRQ